ncbi:MAG: hypothetical protein JWQ41_112, partial [Variovorax sp.]|nr:hypothetical protein [Variovorax sp.]
MLRSGQEPMLASEQEQVPARAPQQPKRRVRQARLLTEPPNRAEDAV